MSQPSGSAHALIGLELSAPPPVRWVAGADTVGRVEQKARELLPQVDAHRDLSSGSPSGSPRPSPVRQLTTWASGWLTTAANTSVTTVDGEHSHSRLPSGQWTSTCTSGMRPV